MQSAKHLRQLNDRHAKERFRVNMQPSKHRMLLNSEWLTKERNKNVHPDHTSSALQSH